MLRPLERGILGASTLISSKDIGKYAFMCGSNFYESDLKIHRYAGKLISIIVFCVKVHFLGFLDLKMIKYFDMLKK